MMSFSFKTLFFIKIFYSEANCDYIDFLFLISKLIYTVNIYLLKEGK